VARRGQLNGAHNGKNVPHPVGPRWSRAGMGSLNLDFNAGVESFHFDQSRERDSMWLLKRHVWLLLHGHGMLKFRTC
jgi:hypothetical protein